MPKPNRDRNMVLRVDDEELAMAHALAEAQDEPIARIIRRRVVRRRRYRQGRLGKEGRSRVV